MNPPLTLALLLVGLSAFAAGLARRLRPLAALRREARTDRRSERLRLLLRDGLLQRRLLDRGERRAGLLHAVVFAAFLVLALRTATLFGQGLSAGFHLPLLGPGTLAGRVYGLLADALELLALGAVGGFLWRRLVSRPDRVTRSPEGLVILLLIAAILVTALGVDGAARLARGEAASALAPAASLGALLLGPLGPAAAARAGAAAFWAHLTLVLAFAGLLPHGKHFHVVTALPNVFLARLPRAALAPLDLEAEDPRLGTATLRDLSWKEAWDLYACTECGRCQTHCPTYQTGKPLSHKEVNRALRRHLAERGPDLAALVRTRQPAARAAAAARLPPLAEVIPPETFWACTTCGWCETACPIRIENVPRLVDLRRHAVLAEARFPDEAGRVFRGLETQGNPWGLGAHRRAEWCADLDVPRAASGAPFDWLFFVGCAGAFDPHQRKVSRDLVALLRLAGVSFAILGEEETCTGDAARRLGNEYLFQAQARALVEVLERRRVKRILVQCPHCLHTLRDELPAFGGRYEVVHHAQLLAELLAAGRLGPAQAPAHGGGATYHDPCYLARWGGVTEPPRALLRAAGLEARELPRNRREGYCCGAGGGRFWLEERLGTRIVEGRVDEALRTLGPAGGTLATGCPFCLTTLRDGIAGRGRAEQVEVLDVAQVLARRLLPPS